LILAEEHRCIREDGGDAKAYYAKSLGPGKGKNRPDNKKEKQCSHCKRKGHNVSDCRILKQEQEENASKPNFRSGTPSSGKASGKHSSSRASASAKIADADASDHSDSSSDETIQVYMARAVSGPSVPITEQAIERVYKTKFKPSSDKATCNTVG